MSESSEPDIMYHGVEWFDQNKGKLLNGALVVIIAMGAYQWINKSQRESHASSESALYAIQNQGLTNFVELAGAYAKVHTEQAGEPVAERAMILSAKTWLQAANYDKAQAAFKSYLVKHADGQWVNEAKLGQAICKESMGDMGAAISEYQSLTNSTDAATKSRATALLEAAQTQLEPLVAKPKPAPAPPVEAPKPEAPKPEAPGAPSVPVAPDNK